MVTETDKTSLLEEKINKLESGYARHIIQEAKIIIEEDIVDEIKTKMALQGYAPSIIQDVILEDISIQDKKLSFRIINEHIVGSGFDIALGMEQGIKPHKIEGNPLAFPGKTAINTPTTIFATSVMHPGVEASFIIRDTMIEKKSTVQERINQKELEWVKSL